MSLRFLLLPLFLILPLVAQAEDWTEEFNEGIHYERLTPAQPTTVQDGKVEVLELFWYGCPHCYAFEPHIESWLKTKANYIEYVRFPAIFSSETWKLHAAAYYTAKALGVVDKIHAPLFDAIHKERRKLATTDALANFFNDVAGVDKEKFNNTMNSFLVQSQLNRSREMSRRYGVGGVPAIIVNGKWRIESGNAGSHSNMLRLAGHLAAREAGK